MRLSFALRLNLAVLAVCAVLDGTGCSSPSDRDPPDRPESAPPVVQPRDRDSRHSRDNREPSQERSPAPSPAPSRRALPPRMRRGSPIAGPSSCPTPR